MSISVVVVEVVTDVNVQINLPGLTFSSSTVALEHFRRPLLGFLIFFILMGRLSSISPFYISISKTNLSMAAHNYSEASIGWS